MTGMHSFTTDKVEPWECGSYLLRMFTGKEFASLVARTSLSQITAREYAKRIADDIASQTSYDSAAWMERGLEATRVSTYYSASETGMLRISMASLGKKSLIFCIGSSSDVEKASLLWDSIWDMISRRS